MHDNETPPLVPHAPRLVYLGPAGDSPDGDVEPLEIEGTFLPPGAIVPLVRRRSPWKRFQDAERVILGSHEKRADILLRGEGVEPEHIRFYLSVTGEPTVFRPLHADSTRLDGRMLAGLEWITATGGEEIAVGPWRFRYERD